jgi:ABC-type nitrate/sulfonate/bicarbonate transport system ATPase subunit
MTAGSKIEICKLCKIFDGFQRSRTAVFDNIDFSISDGEFVSLVGPSGCGKSTLLLCIAGLETHTHGQILLEGQPVTKPGPELAIVFQEYALFPWRSVIRNVEYGLEVAGISVQERHQRAKEKLALVGLVGFEDYWPHELSGGMRQRVAIARALVTEPKVLLLDEPFGALDALTRSSLQKELERICQAAKKTVLFVTHSINEAVYLSDRIVLLSKRPATIRMNVETKLPRPRDPYDPAFIALQEELERSLLTEIADSPNNVGAPVGTEY